MEGALINSILGWELLFFVVMNSFWIGLYYVFRRRNPRPAATRKMNPLVSVIVPVYNKVSYLRETLESVIALDYPRKEILVVNDGSTDGSEMVCREYSRKGLVRLLDFRKNQGKAAALNKAIATSKGDLILTVDADSVLEPDSLSMMVQHFSDKGVGAVAGVVAVKKFKGLLNRFQFIEYIQQAFQRMIQAFWHAVMVLPGPISLYSRAAILDVGGFEHDTLVEDWDITMKIHKHGYKVSAESGAKAFTAPPVKLGDWWQQRIRWSRGGIKITRKHKNILTKSKNKALTRLVFPLHVMWMVVPLIVLPSMIIVMMPSHFAMASLSANLGMFFSSIQAMLAGGVGGSILEIYRIADQMMIDFLDLSRLDWVRSLGYLSGLAFLTFSYVSMRTMGKEFRPRHFLSILLMPIYWMMLNAVYVHSLIKELSGGKMKW